MAKEQFTFQQISSPMKSGKLFLGSQVTLRVLAAAFTLAAATVMFTSKQTIDLVGITFESRYSYSPAFKFFAFANSVACLFSLLSLLVVCCYCRSTYPAIFFYLFMHDLAIMSLLLGACASATAIGYVGEFGNAHAGWPGICDQFEKFCRKMLASVVLSYIALVFFLMLTVSSARKNRNIQV